ncbi:M23 family metallopeptidase [Chryseolinea lacunae]|uniref:M23 family metallopeptidase n=1 Tax=Chryseolinea lacunae TaxID=2801331 RepID=A0ABS1KWF3_9BACT|nr:M23 family metallopeptidase [Chryseolinea lacunae]MBL0743793.1 M23 family metallopeptidase [Chryseolinea lacunae]
MGKIKYRYNPKTCKYEPWYLRGKALQDQIAIFITLSLVLGGIFYFGYSKNFDSLDEQILKKKNLTLKVEWQILEERVQAAYAELNTLIDRDDKNYRVILDSSPLSPEIRQSGVGGSEKFNTEDIKDYPSVMSGYANLEKLKHTVDVEVQSYKELNSILKERVSMWASRPAIQPINNKQLERLHMSYGSRFHPIFKRYMDHKGLDFAADNGTPVYATGDGKVIMVYFSASYGNVIYLEHGHGYETRYAHLSRFAVKEGDVIKRGHVIGYVGSTGNSVSAHLHYEVLFQGSHVNPINFFQRDLNNKEYERLIEAGSIDAKVLD